MKVANEFKKHVNERYKLLEIDLDGVFKRLLLLQKKKYAAIKIADGTESTEIKGLDMKRREYSQLSKNTSQYVLDQILSGESTEVVVEQIHEYLTTMGETIRGGRIPLDDYIINKRLGKDPEAYPDSKSQPHVQVAMRIKARGGAARSGDVISYIFCASPDGSSSKTGRADNAHSPDEIRRESLSVDYEYYITSQVLPPVERLCDNIEGTDRARLAECLGELEVCSEDCTLTKAKVSIRHASKATLLALATRRSSRPWNRRCRIKRDLGMPKNSPFAALDVRNRTNLAAFLMMLV